jgi:hypothetical protein
VTHLAAIRMRDAVAPESRFDSETVGNMAFIDRRWLLAELDRVSAELAAANVAPKAEYFGGEP